MDRLQRIKSTDLKTGMVFSAPVFFDDGINMFLAEGKKLKNHHIEALFRWNIPYVITYGRLLSDKESAVSDAGDLEEIEDLEEFDVDENTAVFGRTGIEKIACNLSSSDPAAVTMYDQLVKRIRVQFMNFKRSAHIDRKEIDSAVSSSIILAEKGWSDIMGTICAAPDNETDYAKAAADTAIIAAACALRLKYPPHKIQYIAAAAVLHDIGMLTIPDSVLNKKSQLSKQEFEMLRLHPIQAARYAAEILFYPKETSAVILQHHERRDGTGYPSKVKMQAFEESAQIVSIADAFSAMITRKAYRESIPGFEAIKKLLDEKQTRFSHDVLKAFIGVLGVYPSGSIVLLNNGAVAQVTAENPGIPFMPQVRILAESKTSPYEVQLGDVFSLDEKRDISIVRALRPNEYRAIA